VVLLRRHQKQQAGFGTAVGSQVGALLLVYAWFCCADVKNSKLFLELRCSEATEGGFLSEKKVPFDPKETCFFLFFRRLAEN